MSESIVPAIFNYTIFIKFETTIMFLKDNDSDHTKKKYFNKGHPEFLYR
jgi:hypothetical protein